ncbi:ABC transporter substrate-binding protein [Cohnella boryungensis]|uniref:ABC transporter substrate-binding protein n=1 Tax=Cohnella boryungensis TaxID=768479 RepID=A0ABV8SHR3_9BACL
MKPVGTSEVYDGAAYANELDNVEQMGAFFEPSLEAIVALEPDLIIVPTEETYDVLNKVAPTILMPLYSLTMEGRLAFLGKVFGKEEEAKQRLESFNVKLESAKEKLRAAGLLDKTVTIIEGGQKKMTVVMSSQYGRGSQVLYEYLGMKAPEIVQRQIDVATVGTGKEVSLEVLQEYSGDFIFRSSWEGMDNLAEDKVWNSIPAVKEGRVIEIEFGFSYYNDIYSLDKQLDFVVEQMLATANNG